MMILSSTDIVRTIIQDSIFIDAQRKVYRVKEVVLAET